MDRTHTCMHVRACAHVRMLCVRACVCVRTHMCECELCAYMCVRASTCMHVRAHVYARACVHSPTRCCLINVQSAGGCALDSDIVALQK